jgi:Protein of unknown function (DUF1059)
MDSMEKVLRCDCGFEARAEDESGLVTQVQRHAVEAHGMALSADEALLLASRAQLGEPTWPRRVASETKDQASGHNNYKEER